MKRAGSRWLLAGLTVALFAAPLWRSARAHRAATSFPIPPRAPTAATDAPFFREEFIETEPATPTVHVASFCELPGGRLAASWYGGSREGARDVAIYLATHGSDAAAKWSAPTAVVTRESATRELQRYVRKVGNALLFASEAGQLHLIYVSIAVGGWSGSSLNLKSSSDGGQTWARSRRLALSPFFNVSELVKNHPTQLADGGWAVPIYHEMLGKFPAILWLHDLDGSSLPRITKTRIAGGRTVFQPTLVPLGGRGALAFFRDASADKTLQLARTDDAGAHWSEPVATPLPNPDSGLDALRLVDGRLLLAFNDSKTGRENLRLALSKDEGRSWQRVATLAEAAGAEFSYPSLTQTANGEIHVVFTWKRRAIKHVVFNTAWLSSAP